MKVDKRHKFQIPCYLIICLLICFPSCNWTEVQEMVLVKVVNEVNEDLSVQTGKTFIHVTVTQNDTMTVPVVKGANIKARGKTTKKLYGTRSFSRDWDTWIVH
jgi:hypothetical protein